MIPDLNDDGYLPAGIHPATLEEVADRFGTETELRRVQMQSLHWLIDLASKAGVRRVLINGSFIAENPEPNDVDCALLVDSDYPADPEAALELEAGLPFIQMYILEQEGYDYYATTFFATDRQGRPKGLIEVACET